MIDRITFARLCRARDALCGTCERPLSIHEVARDAGMSTGQLIRLFSAVFGETPHQLRTRARLDRAKRLLARGRSVTEVGIEVGFSSLGSFSDLFSRRVGVAPSVYRRQVRAMVQLPADPTRVLTPGCFDLMAAAFAQFPRSAPTTRPSCSTP